MADEDTLETAAPAAEEDVVETPDEEVTIWAPEAGGTDLRLRAGEHMKPFFCLSKKKIPVFLFFCQIDSQL